MSAIQLCAGNNFCVLWWIFTILSLMHVWAIMFNSALVWKSEMSGTTRYDHWSFAERMEAYTVYGASSASCLKIWYTGICVHPGNSKNGVGISDQFCAKRDVSSDWTILPSAFSKFNGSAYVFAVVKSLELFFMYSEELVKFRIWDWTQITSSFSNSTRG